MILSMSIWAKMTKFISILRVRGPVVEEGTVKAEL